ncbi:MAG: ATP-binding protein [Planctomycetales bacterium]|nr:ATP-binding protein [Planctomycetales bacterium]
MACLKLVISNRVVERHDLKQRTIIGRSRQADILLADPLVSREHALVLRKGTQYVLEDLGSANGVLVNGSPVVREALAEGDVLGIGDAVLVFTREDIATEPGRVVEIAAETSLPAGADWEALPDVAFRMPSRRDAMEVAGEAMERLLAASCLDKTAAYHLHLAAMEALANGHRHGNKEDPTKSLLLRVQRDSRRATCRVRDDGPGFDFPLFLKIGRSGDAISVARERYKEGRPGGLGIMLMVRSVDLVEFNETGNEISLTKCPGDVFQTATIYGKLGFEAEPPPPGPATPG